MAPKKLIRGDDVIQARWLDFVCALVFCAAVHLMISREALRQGGALVLYNLDLYIMSRVY